MQPIVPQTKVADTKLWNATYCLFIAVGNNEFSFNCFGGCVYGFKVEPLIKAYSISIIWEDEKVTIGVIQTFIHSFQISALKITMKMETRRRFDKNFPVLKAACHPKIIFFFFLIVFRLIIIKGSILIFPVLFIKSIVCWPNLHR